MYPVEIKVCIMKLPLGSANTGWFRKNLTNISQVYKIMWIWQTYWVLYKLPHKINFPLFSNVTNLNSTHENVVYIHAPITPCSGNVKIQEIVPFTKKQDVSKSKWVLFPMSQKILKFSLKIIIVVQNLLKLEDIIPVKSGVVKQ